ncbi:MAG: transcription antitermination factor NusB [Bryobacteraceae bacterium]|nr:transcription antitermination factor NusB [Bryobacteraceae bacterium]
MPSRQRSRQRALQMLYLWDMRRQPVRDSLLELYRSLAADGEEQENEPDAFTQGLVRGAVEQTAEIDKRILEHSEHWRLERMAVVDRNILRLAVYEMMNHDTPHAVVIDQALELARRYSTEEAVSFVNAVLDAVRRALEKNSFAR